MTFDLAAHLGAMTRAVENVERDGKPAKAVIASRIYDADAADLWDALTDRERIRRWFAPVSGELKLGGRFQVENNAGGTISECEPERKFAATWEFAGAVSWITVTLTPETEGTRLELEHVAHISPHWEQFGPGAVGVGWELGFLGLARHLVEPEANLPQEAEQGWYATQDYKNLIRTSSDDWGRAAIAAGEDRAHALAAAEATRQAYTGETPPPEL
jgi:uncharacterized protein YndB with AHSA1/START domain